MKGKNRLITALGSRVKVAKDDRWDDLGFIERQRLKLKLGLNPLTNIVLKEKDMGYLGSHALHSGKHPLGIGLVRVGKDTPASVEAHELGHLTHSQNAFEDALSYMSHPMGDAAAILPGIMASVAHPDSAASKYAPLVGALLSAPKLTTEALASYRGLKALKEIRPDESVLPAAIAQLSYPVQLLTPSVLAPMMIRKKKLENLKNKLKGTEEKPQ